MGFYIEFYIAALVPEFTGQQSLKVKQLGFSGMIVTDHMFCNVAACLYFMGNLLLLIVLNLVPGCY